MNSNRISVYTESGPLDRDVVAHGLHRAAPPILRSILDHIDGIAIHPLGRRFPNKDFDRDLVHLCASLPLIPTLLCKVFRRFPAFDPGIGDVLAARLLAPALLEWKSDTLFCFVGADIGTLTRAAKLAATAGKSYVFYVVDDFLHPLRLAGADETVLRKAAERVGTVLRGAKHIFTITDGLGVLLSKQYGVSSTTLQLAFEPTQRPKVDAKNQIIYLGSINFLYADGLLELFKAVERVRHADGTDLTVRLTVPAKVAAHELGALPSFVISSPIETAEGLAQEIASSLFAFLPYSFDLSHKTMVATSFPSKSMEYLAHARSIVVYGPDYGVATKCFREADLPSIVSSLEELEEAIRTHLALQPEYSARYGSYLSETHSLAAARAALCAGLGLKER